MRFENLKFVAEGKTRLVDCNDFKMQVFREEWVKAEAGLPRTRQYVAHVKVGEDIMVLTGDCLLSVLCKVARTLLANLKEEGEKP